MVKVKYKTTKKINQKVIDELNKIQKGKGGLTPEAVVKRASEDKKNPLHDFFNWDTEDAAYQWNLQQARCLIDTVMITIGEDVVHAYGNVATINVKDSGTERYREYKPIIEILNNEEYKKQLVATALKEAEYWGKKYNTLNKLRPLKQIFKAINKAKKEFKI